jgi:hypothetical protein
VLFFFPVSLFRRVFGWLFLGEKEPKTPQGAFQISTPKKCRASSRLSNRVCGCSSAIGAICPSARGIKKKNQQNNLGLKITQNKKLRPWYFFGIESRWGWGAWAKGKKRERANCAEGQTQV